MDEEYALIEEIKNQLTPDEIFKVACRVFGTGMVVECLLTMMEIEDLQRVLQSASSPVAPPATAPPA